MIARADRRLTRVEKVFVLLSHAIELLDQEMDESAYPWERRRAADLRVRLEDHRDALEQHVRFAR